MNNPLNSVDPNGYFSLKKHLKNPFRDFNNHGDRVGGVILGLPFGSKGYSAVFNFLQGGGGYQVKSAVISVASIFCGYAVAACNGGGQAGLAKAYGASDRDAFNTGGVAALSSGLFQAAGAVSGTYGASSPTTYLAHAGAGCVSAAAGGGNCGQGAASAIFGKFATNTIGATPGQFDTYGFVATVVASGIGSVIGGGKFENGAKAAAYGYLFNNLTTTRETWVDKYESLLSSYEKSNPLEVKIFKDLLVSIPAYVASNESMWASVIMTFEASAARDAQLSIAAAISDFYPTVIGASRFDPRSWFDRIFTPNDVKGAFELPSLYREAIQIQRTGPQVFNRNFYENVFGKPTHSWSAYPLLNRR
jgi:hypothetical protein